MNEKPQIWHSWANFLHKWGVSDLAASLLEMGGPFNILAAQAVHFSQPFLGTFIASNQLEVMADMLEDEAETNSFIKYLKGGEHS
jgi:hypothetical protein